MSKKRNFFAAATIAGIMFFGFAMTGARPANSGVPARQPDATFATYPSLNPGNEVVVRLPVGLSSGHTWVPKFDHGLLQEESMTVAEYPNNTGADGRPQIEIFTFKALAGSGEATLKFYYVGPGQSVITNQDKTVLGDIRFMSSPINPDVARRQIYDLSGQRDLMKPR